MKFKNERNNGYTLIELLVTALVISVLLAIAIPILSKARISSNEANARKALQVLRDVEELYFEQDLNEDNLRNYTNLIGSLGTPNSLRDPRGNNNHQDSLIDSTFEGSIVDDGNQAIEATCSDSKAGYCIGWSSDVATDADTLQNEFGWEASMTSFNRNGRRDFAVFSDKVIRCIISPEPKGFTGKFDATKTSSTCDD